MSVEIRVLQAGAVVYRCEGTTPRILVVEARKLPVAWVFPKGHVEEGESIEVAALREVREEAGVVAELIMPLSSLEFRSGDEQVQVHYFLARHVTSTNAAEKRALRWCTAEEALATLTHEDGRGLLHGALAFINDDIAHRNVQQTASSWAGIDHFSEFLLAEFSHTAESLLRNEEDGEKRASFFLAIAAGASGVLTFTLGEGTQIRPTDVNPLVVLMLMIVILFGHFTLVRLAHRNRVTDGYKQGLQRIRRYFLEGPADTRRAFLAFDPYRVVQLRSPSWRAIGRGGWLESVAAVESLLSGVLVAMVLPTPLWWTDAGIGVMAAGPIRKVVCSGC